MTWPLVDAYRHIVITVMAVGVAREAFHDRSIELMKQLVGPLEVGTRRRITRQVQRTVGVRDLERTNVPPPRLSSKQ